MTPLYLLVDGNAVTTLDSALQSLRTVVTLLTFYTLGSLPVMNPRYDWVRRTLKHLKARDTLTNPRLLSRRCTTQPPQPSRHAATHHQRIARASGPVVHTAPPTS